MTKSEFDTLVNIRDYLITNQPVLVVHAAAPLIGYELITQLGKILKDNRPDFPDSDKLVEYNASGYCTKTREHFRGD